MSDLEPISAAQQLDSSERLFAALAEELKLPLQQIARRSELAEINREQTDGLLVGSIASGALELLDNYLLCMRLQRDPALKFAVQPTSVASTLYEARSRLRSVAANYNINLELDIAGKYGPVLAHRQALLAALVSMGYSLMSSLPSEPGHDRRLYLSAHRGPRSVVAGIYSDDVLLVNSAILRRGRELYGRVRQPLTSTSPHAGAGVFIADTISRAMSLNLKASKYHNKSGLAISLPLSPQLQLL